MMRFSTEGTMVPKLAVNSLRVLQILATILFVSGIASLALTATFAFEEPNNPLLLLSAGLLVTPLVAVFAHLTATSELNRSQKRIWLRQLTGRRAPSAWAEYLTCGDLRAAASRFVNAEQQGRFGVTGTE